MKKQYDKVAYKEQKQDETKEILAKLEQGVKDVFTSDKFKEYLNVMSKFHNYSMNNTILIMLQKPDAQRVAGYNTWKELGRQVQKGEKAIKVLAPSSFKKEVQAIDQKGKPIIGEDGKPKTEMKEIQYFRQVSVFDVSQTQGKELPTLTTELRGNVEEKAAIYKAINNITGLEVQEEKIKGKAKGYYQPASLTGEEAKIVVRKGMEDLQSIKTAIHETAHCLLHDPNNKEALGATDTRNSQEVQAEAVAYVVGQRLGLDTSDYSFAYIASWSAGRELKELKQSLDKIQQTAETIYSAIEKEIGHLKDIDKLLEETTLEKAQNKTMVEIISTEGSDFKEGEVIELREANRRFKEYDDKVVGLKKEAYEKGEYYPYFKTRFNIKTIINGEESNYAGRYDIGDGEGDLISHIKNSTEELKEFAKTITDPKQKADYEKQIKYVEGKLIPKLEKEAAKESITQKLKKAQEKSTQSNGSRKNQEKEKEGR